jgi:hypothetical protein
MGSWNDKDPPKIEGSLLASSQPAALSGNQVPQSLSGFALAQAKQSAIPELSDPLAGNPHHAADFLEGSAVAVVQTKV